MMENMSTKVASQIAFCVWHVCVPIAVAYFVLFLGIELSDQSLNLVVSVYAIVSALLFGSVFSVFSVASSLDRAKIAREFGNIANFKRDLRGINRHILYLVAASAVFVLGILILTLVELNLQVETWIVSAATTHFFLIFAKLLLKVFRFMEFAYRKL